MAEYNPTTFEEFLEALSDTDTTKVVNCPENAEWNASEFEPEGHSGSILLYGTINGNGTRIKNLIIRDSSGTTDGVILINGTTTDLHFVDGVWAAGGNGVVRLMSANSLVQLCTFSASVQTVSNTVRLFDFQISGNNKAYTYRCAANVEFATAQNVNIQWYNIEGTYNNIKISGSRVTSVSICGVSSLNPNGKMEYSYVICDTPAMTTFTGATFFWGLVRSTGSNVTDLRFIGDGSGNKVTLACTTDFPNASQYAQGLRLCSESQLRDAAYLQSVGFPIGV